MEERNYTNILTTQFRETQLHCLLWFVYTRMSLKSELCIRGGSAHNLAVVEAAPEGDVGLEVDDDAEVEQDEADHQVLVDSQAGTAQGAEMVFFS